MLTKRIVPCLDIKDGRTVKGVNFQNIRDAGDPVELAALYARMGADELVFLDITATEDGRHTLVSLVENIAAEIDIPFTVGGGVRSKQDVERLLNAGADKVAVNSAAVRDPNLVKDLSLAFGSQCIVVAIDAKTVDDKWQVFVSGGKEATDRELFEWASQLVTLGAGEILFTSMDHDGTKSGFALEALEKLHQSVPIPIIASGGAGKLEHFEEAFISGKADAALAASVFHYEEISIPELKRYLNEQGISIRV